MKELLQQIMSKIMGLDEPAQALKEFRGLLADEENREEKKRAKEIHLFEGKIVKYQHTDNYSFFIKMDNEKKIHEKTYKNYLLQLADVDLSARGEALDAKMSDRELVINFYGEPFTVSSAGVKNSAGQKANLAVSVVLCKYVLQAPENVPEDGEWITYREFRDSGPLLGFFNDNTKKTIERTFAGSILSLKKACERLGGIPYSYDKTYDLSMEITALPRIPVLLRFNDRDDEFPAQCSILFKQSAEKYLDMDCLTIVGTFLTGNLIKT